MKSISETNYLANFLRDASNSVSREVLLAHRVAFDLKLGSALTGFDLRVYRPDVDRDGYDMLIEQRSIARFLQLKSVMAGSRTGSWEVRCHLLHPSRNRSERLAFGLPALGLGDGLDGGVLLIDFDVRGDDLKIGYRFFDLAVAAAHALGHTHMAPERMEEVEELLEALRREEGRGTIRVPKWMFLAAPSAEAVLELLGVRTRFMTSWAYHVLCAYRLNRHPALPADGKSIEEHTQGALQALERIQTGKLG